MKKACVLCLAVALGVGLDRMFDACTSSVFTRHPALGRISGSVGLFARDLIS
jgi:hypothetical protein